MQGKEALVSKRRDDYWLSIKCIRSENECRYYLIRLLSLIFASQDGKLTEHSIETYFLHLLWVRAHLEPQLHPIQCWSGLNLLWRSAQNLRFSLHSKGCFAFSEMAEYIVFIASKCCFSSFPWCWGADFLIKRPWWPCWKTFSDLQPSYLTMLSTLSGPFALSGKHDRNNLLLYYHYYSIHSAAYPKVTNNRVLSSLRAIVKG